MNKDCPDPIKDLKLNLKNRQKAIDEYGYGPANPNLPNKSFWDKKAKMWKIDASEAKTMRCGNCAAFNVSPHIKECIEKYLSDDPEATVEAGELGYCQMLKFKCASKRTCDAWVVGGPIKDDKKSMADGGVLEGKKKTTLWAGVALVLGGIFLIFKK